MGSKKRSKPFQSKWTAATNTIEIATSRAAKLPPETVQGLADSLCRSMRNLTVVEWSAQAWLDLRMACVVSRRVERMGVVKGMSAIWEDAYGALESIRGRSMLTGTWRCCTPSDSELACVREMARMHGKQLSFLSVGEFDQVLVASRSELAGLPKIPLLASNAVRAA